MGDERGGTTQLSCCIVIKRPTIQSNWFFFISFSINSNLFLQSEFNLVSHSVENILFCTFNFTFLPYPMLIKLLKSCIDILINPILCIVNNSLFEGKFSEKLKSAIVSFKSINKAFFCCSQKN